MELNATLQSNTGSLSSDFLGHVDMLGVVSESEASVQ